MERKQIRMAMEVLSRLRAEYSASHRAAFVVTLSACAKNLSFMEGKQVHAMAVANECEAETVIRTAIVNMYGKCGCHAEAKNVFDRIHERDAIMWNAMITVYVQNGRGNQALTLFDQMLWQGMEPNQATFVNILCACASNVVSIMRSIEIHVHIIEHGCRLELILGNSLVTVYGKRGDLDRAREVFDRMHEHNVVSWNAIISVHTQLAQSMEAHSLFLQMAVEGVTPNEATFMIYLSACTALLHQVRIIHARILTTVGVDCSLGSSLVHAYGKCCNAKAAWNVFSMMHEQSLFTWTNMIAAYCRNGQEDKALQTFYRMHEEGIMADKVTLINVLDSCSSVTEGYRLHVRVHGCGCLPDLVVATTLIKMYGKFSSVVNAKTLFDSMLERSEILWSSMLTALAENGLDKDALQLYHDMQQEGLVIDTYTLGSVLDACASQASFTDGIWVHASIVNSKYESNVIVGTALVNLYGKCGSLPNAQRSFDKLASKDLIAWNALIAAYAQYGHAVEAFDVLVQMSNEFAVPNEVTFVSILSACSHAGLVAEGFWFCSFMSQKYFIHHTLEHYDCIIDLLGRAGMLHEAESLIRMMPIQPTVISLMSLLSACRYQSDIDRAGRIALKIFSENPNDPALYIMLSNIYSVYQELPESGRK